MSERRVSPTGRRRLGPTIADGTLTAVAFVAATVRFWLFVFPSVAAELRHWRRSAARIPSEHVRPLALAALDKRSNMEGAGAFATFVRLRHRRDAVRALVAFQAIYNHADMLAEQPNGDPPAVARRLHEALLLALEPGAAAPSRRSLATGGDDGGYLAELIEACRWSLARLPGYASAAPAARLAAARIVAFQSLSLGSREKLETWANRDAPAGSGLEWWEAAAAAGSSLAVDALIAASASPALRSQDVEAIDGAYSSVIGALHSLLDSLVDEAEDAATGQLRLIGCYRSPSDAAAHMRRLAERSLEAARELPRGRAHALLVSAMACSYLADRERFGAGSDDVVAAVREAIGPLSRPLLLVFRLRRLAARLTRSPAVRESPPQRSPQQSPSTPALVDPGKRGAGARAT